MDNPFARHRQDSDTNIPLIERGYSEIMPRVLLKHSSLPIDTTIDHNTTKLSTATASIVGALDTISKMPNASLELAEGASKLAQSLSHGRKKKVRS